MKVSELSGALLDYWVAKAEGYKFKLYSTSESGEMRYAVSVPGEKTLGCARLVKNVWLENVPAYSTDWSQGGPIIEREQFAIIPVIGGTWCAERNVPTGGDDYDVSESFGQTPLIAAMRCHVASVYGAEVDDS